MVYLLGALMGYFVGTNYFVQKQAKSFIGCGFSNQTAGLLSSLGGFGVFCIFCAAYFVGSDYGNGFLDGLFFVLVAYGGIFISGFLQIPGFNYLFSALTIFINIALAAAVYSLT